MPYTTEQLRTVSNLYRGNANSCYEYISRNAMADAIRMLRRMESNSRWDYDVAINGTRLIRCESCEEVIGYVSRHSGDVVYRYEDDVVEVDGHIFCDYCCANNEDYFECQNCNEWHHMDDMVAAEGYGYFCNDYCAARQGYRQCDCCNELVHEYGLRTVHNNYDEEWCDDCVDRYARYCDNCEEWFPEDYVHYNEGTDQDLCESCEEEIERDESSQHLHYYSWTPVLNFHNVGEENPLYLGIELETDGGNQRGTYCDELFALCIGGKDFGDHFYMTEDSSLNNGVEITGHPMTLKYHVSMEPIYQAISETALRFGFKSHDGGRCGLHVHVNKTFFGKSKLTQEVAYFKLLRLLQRFEPLFFIFSRRKNTSWCDYKSSRDYGRKIKDVVSIRNHDVEPSPFDKAKHAAGTSFHSQCVGFRNATFEFRIFRGTLKWSTYYACLGLVDGLCRVSKRHGTEWVETVNWPALIDEVVKSVNDDFARECLVNYLDEKELR